MLPLSASLPPHVGWQRDGRTGARLPVVTVVTLVPIKPTRFRVEGTPVATYLEFGLADEKIKQVSLEKDEAPKAVLVPSK
jgi:hypothetical protein